jgi:hypothetical protein
LSSCGWISYPFAAAAVAHTSGRIGDSLDMWEHGVLSHVNAAGRAAGLVPGAAVRSALTIYRAAVAQAGAGDGGWSC